MEGSAARSPESARELGGTPGASQALEPEAPDLGARKEEEPDSGIQPPEPEPPGSQARSISWNPETISAEELHRLLLKAHRLGSAVRIKFLRLLLTLEETRLYTQLGFPSTHAYASRYFGFERAETYELLRVARALGSLPLSERSFGTGALSWSALKELSRVADSETEAEWVELAKRVSVEELRAEVQHAIRTKRRRPRGKGYGLPGLPVRLSFTLEPAECAMVEKALELAAREAGEALGTGPLKLKGAFVYLATRVVEGRLLEAEPRRWGSRESPYALVLKHCADCRRTELKRPEGFVEVDPEVVDRVAGEAVVCEISPEEEMIPEAEARASGETGEETDAHSEAGAETEIPSGAGPESAEDSGAGGSPSASFEAEVRGSESEAAPDRSQASEASDAVSLGEAASLAAGEDVRGAEAPEGRAPEGGASGGEASEGGVPEGKSGADRPLAPGEAQRRPEKDRPTPPSMARKILLRDGAVCANPHCRSKKNLQCHHIRYRSRGGKTVLWNQILLCARCHALVHAGFLVIRGDPLTGLEFLAAGDRLRRNLEAELEELASIPRVDVVVNRAAPTAACLSQPGLVVGRGEEQPGSSEARSCEGRTRSSSDGETSDRRGGGVIGESRRGRRALRDLLAELPWGPVAVLEKFGYSKNEAAERVRLAMEELRAEARAAGGNGNGSGEVELDENRILNRALRIRKKVCLASPA